MDFSGVCRVLLLTFYDLLLILISLYTVLFGIQGEHSANVSRPSAGSPCSFSTTLYHLTGDLMKALSHLFSTMRGSVGGITYLSNQFHQIVARQRTSPVNPMTNRQSQIRGAFSDASVIFEALSAADKQAWSDYAATLVYQGPLGPYTIPGRQVCIGNVGTGLYLNDRAQDVGVPDASPPLAPGFLSLSDLGVSAPDPVSVGFKVSFRNNNAEESLIYAYRSFAFPATRNRFKGPWLTETLDSIAIPADTSSSLDFVGLNEDSIYFTIVRAITADPPYRMSPAYILRAIAVDAPGP